MLDLKYVTEHIDEVIERLSTRNGDFNYLRNLVSLQEERKTIIVKKEALLQERNESSKLIGQLKREGKDVSDILKKVETIKVQIPELDARQEAIENELFKILSITQNLPHASVPIGKDEEANV